MINTEQTLMDDLSLIMEVRGDIIKLVGVYTVFKDLFRFSAYFDNCVSVVTREIMIWKLIFINSSGKLSVLDWEY